MTKPKLTPWFPYGIKPVRVGVYRADFEPDRATWNDPDPWYAYFDGKQWGWLCQGVDDALHTYLHEPDRRHPNLEWCGLFK
jgi:hypothetical protein